MAATAPPQTRAATIGRRRPWWLMVTAWASMAAAATTASASAAGASSSSSPPAGLGFLHPVPPTPAAAAARRPWRQQQRQQCQQRQQQRGRATTTRTTCMFMERAAADNVGLLASLAEGGPLFLGAPHHRGDARMAALLGLASERRTEDFAAAVRGLERPQQVEVVEALILNLRRHTNGGMLPAADGSLPKLQQAQRALLVEYVPAVLSIVDRLEEAGHHHEDARVALYATEALSYDVSVKNLVHAAPQLARIFKNIDMMVEKHPDLKGGAPFIIQGMMHLNAPAPLRSVRKAKECFEAAYRVDAASPRNNYFCGVAAYLERDYARAHAHFAAALAELALEQAPESPVGGGGGEGDVMGRDPADEYLEAQCRLGLELAGARLEG